VITIIMMFYIIITMIITSISPLLMISGNRLMTIIPRQKAVTENPWITINIYQEIN